MYQGNVARTKRCGIIGQFPPIGMRTQAILRHSTLHLYLLPPQFQCILLTFSEIQQLSARRFVVLIASNKDRSVRIGSQTSRIPDTWATRKHTATREKTGRWTSQDTFAFPLVAHKGDIWSSKRQIPLTNLTLKAWSEKFRQ